MVGKYTLKEMFNVLECILYFLLSQLRCFLPDIANVFWLVHISSWVGNRWDELISLHLVRTWVSLKTGRKWLENIALRTCLIQKNTSGILASSQVRSFLPDIMNVFWLVHSSCCRKFKAQDKSQYSGRSGHCSGTNQLQPFLHSHVTQLKIECPGKKNRTGPAWVTYSTLGQGWLVQLDWLSHQDCSQRKILFPPKEIGHCFQNKRE